MAEVRISRSKNTTNKTKNIKPLNIQLDISTLNTICRFVLSDSTYVRRYDLSQIRKFMSLIDTEAMSLYSPEVKDRIDFISFGLEARLDKRLVNKDTIFAYVSSKFNKDIDFISVSEGISREDVDWVNQMVSETLKYSFIYVAVPRMRELCNEFSQTSIAHRGEIVPEFEEFYQNMLNKFREARVQDANNTIFSLKEDTFENQIMDTYAAVRSPSRRLRTGMVGFNLLTGGLENGRVYMLIGDSGVGKSVTLLNIMLQLKRYNTDYKTKDPTKTPCIVMLTMENSMTETITRLFALVSESNAQMANFTNINEVFRILREEGQLVVNENNPIDIIIKYKPNHSVNTDYLYDLYDELSDMGYEPICLIQDHVKRIRSVETEKEFRIELGNIVNEFKSFAVEKDIPVITDSHVNRQGSIIIEKGTNRGVADVTRRIGKGDTGESIMMIENLDMAIVINKEWTDQERKHTMYMCFSAIKMRDNASITYIAQPFVTGSSIKLVEDVNLPNPVYKTTLKQESNLWQYNNPSNMRNTPYNQINDVAAGYTEDESYFENGDRHDYTIEDFNIGVPEIEYDVRDSDDDDNIITKESIQPEEEDMWAKAERLGMICPIRLTGVPEDKGESIIDGIRNMLN